MSVLATVVSLAMAGQANAALVLSDAGDTFVQNNQTTSSTPNGSTAAGSSVYNTLLIKSGSAVRHVYLEFNVGSSDLSSYNTATLNLSVTTDNQTTTPFVVDVYGVGSNTTANNFDETTLVYPTAKGSTTTSTSNPYGINASTTTLLGSFTANITGTNAGKGAFSSDALLDFVKSSGVGTDGYVSLMLVRESTDSTFNTGFASKELSATRAPNLTLDVPEPASIGLASCVCVLALARRKRLPAGSTAGGSTAGRK